MVCFLWKVGEISQAILISGYRFTNALSVEVQGQSSSYRKTMQQDNEISVKMPRKEQVKRIATDQNNNINKQNIRKKICPLRKSGRSSLKLRPIHIYYHSISTTYPPP
jgi:hypothetical protein